MKRLFFIFGLCLTLGLTLQAQESTKSVGNHLVTTAVDLSFLFEEHQRFFDKIGEFKGYRLQIAARSDRSAIYELKSEVFQNFRAYNVYLTYEQPYYKLRLGDFKTRLAAQEALLKIRDTYPETMVVPDWIVIDR